MHIQPVSVHYVAPYGADVRLYGWWGNMDFAPHLLRILAQPRQGAVEVVFHQAVAVDDFKGRKDLAAHCEAVIRAAHEGRPRLG